MSPRNGSLIKLDGVGKTFYTDEVETHALADIHLEVKAGEYVAISGHPDVGNRLYSRFWDCSIRLRMEPICSKASPSRI